MSDRYIDLPAAVRAKTYVDFLIENDVIRPKTDAEYAEVLDRLTRGFSGQKLQKAS